MFYRYFEGGAMFKQLYQILGTALDITEFSELRSDEILV
jgi:hypothetical protein